MSTDPHIAAVAGMMAAVEYCRIQYTGMAGHADLAATQTGLDSIREDCETGQLDLPGALAAITLRAAQLACQASSSVGVPLTVPAFLAALEDELTTPSR